MAGLVLDSHELGELVRRFATERRAAVAATALGSVSNRGGSCFGGRERKDHPGVALREAARLVEHEPKLRQAEGRGCGDRLLSHASMNSLRRLRWLEG
jgi:hypothetical protein